VGKHVDREAPIFRISFAIVLMNENRAWQRQILLSVKRIVCEQDPAFLADGKGSQTLAAGAMTRSHFRLCGMTVAR
jgi:hypothetical protein